MILQDVTLTLQCDNACPFCPQPHHDSLFLTLEKIEPMLREVRAAGDSITLTGGEPTIHPEFLSVVELCRKLGFARVGIVTNGRSLADVRFARRVLEAGVNGVALSLHSHRAAVHDEMSGARGAWEDSRRGLANLVTLNARLGLGVDVRTNTVFGPLNGPDILDTVRFLGRLGVRTQFLLDTVSRDGGKDIVPYPLVAAAYAALSREAEFSGYHVRFRGFPGCVFGAPPDPNESDRAFALPSANGSRLFWEPIALRTMTDSDAQQLGRYIRGMEGRFGYDEALCAPCSLRAKCNGIQDAYRERRGLSGLGPGFKARA